MVWGTMKDLPFWHTMHISPYNLHVYLFFAYRKNIFPPEMHYFLGHKTYPFNPLESRKWRAFLEAHGTRDFAALLAVYWYSISSMQMQDLWQGINSHSTLLVLNNILWWICIKCGLCSPHLNGKNVMDWDWALGILRFVVVGDWVGGIRMEQKLFPQLISVLCHLCWDIILISCRNDLIILTHFV